MHQVISSTGVGLVQPLHSTNYVHFVAFPYNMHLQEYQEYQKNQNSNNDNNNNQLLPQGHRQRPNEQPTRDRTAIRHTNAPLHKGVHLK